MRVILTGDMCCVFACTTTGQALLTTFGGRSAVSHLGPRTKLSMTSALRWTTFPPSSAPCGRAKSCHQTMGGLNEQLLCHQTTFGGSSLGGPIPPACDGSFPSRGRHCSAPSHDACERGAGRRGGADATGSCSSPKGVPLLLCARSGSRTADVGGAPGLNPPTPLARTAGSRTRVAGGAAGSSPARRSLAQIAYAARETDSNRVAAI
jgi:hypothetical protein